MSEHLPPLSYRRLDEWAAAIGQPLDVLREQIASELGVAPSEILPSDLMPYRVAKLRETVLARRVQ